MKAMVIAGIILMVLGAVVLFRGITYSSEQSVVKVGSFKAAVQERRYVPPWVGGVAIVGGLALILASGHFKHNA